MRPVAVLTRPAGRNEALAARLSAAGWQTLVLPALTLELLAPARLLPAPEDFDLVVFVSGNAARLYLERADLPGGWPAATLAATVGPGSAQVLRDSSKFGSRGRILHPPADASAHDSEALWQLLSARPLPRRALLVRGETGRDWLADRLSEAGVQVQCHALYRRRPARWSGESLLRLRRMADDSVGDSTNESAASSTAESISTESISRLAAESSASADPAMNSAAGSSSASQALLPPVWLLTSGAGIDAVADAVRAEGLFDWWARGRFVVTHPKLSKYLLAVAQGAGQTPVVKICMPSDEAIFEAIMAF